MSKPHLFPIAIAPADIDFMGHVNNARYLTWVQDAVIDHWKTFAPVEAVAQHLWVALKHEITYRRPAFLGDERDRPRRAREGPGRARLLMRRWSAAARKSSPR